MTKVKESLKKSELVFVEKSTNPRFQDIEGQVFNELTALGYAGRPNGRTSWYCECTCGTVKICETYHLLNGKVKSCGCKTGELISSVIKKTWRYKNGIVSKVDRHYKTLRKPQFR